MSDGGIAAEHCESLAARVAAGDAEAARALIGELWPHWVRLARASRSLQRVPALDDAALEVATRMAEKLGRPGSRELALFPLWKERNEGRSFADWVKICTSNVARDIAREQLGPRPRKDDVPSLKRALNDLALALPLDDIGTRPPITAVQTARELMVFASLHLPEAHHRALSLWLEGTPFEEIAGTLSLPGPLDAQRTVRAAVATLRRRFLDI